MRIHIGFALLALAGAYLGTYLLLQSNVDPGSVASQFQWLLGAMSLVFVPLFALLMGVLLRAQPPQRLYRR